MQEETPIEKELVKHIEEIGLMVAQARMRLGLSQYKFANEIGISRNSLREIECGKTFPRTSTICAICRITDLTPEDFLQSGKSDKEEPAPLCMNELPLPANPQERKLCKLLITAILSVFKCFDWQT